MSWAAARDDVLERLGPCAPRRRCHSNRHTVAAAARFSDSARPACGTRTDRRRAPRCRRATREPRCRTRTPPAPTDPTGTGRRPRRRHREHAEPFVLHGGDRLRRLGASDDRQMEQRARRRAHGLRVVDVDRAGGEHDAAGTRRVRRAEHGAGVPGIAHLVQDGHAPVVGQRVAALDRGHGETPDQRPAASRWRSSRASPRSLTSWTSSPPAEPAPRAASSSSISEQRLEGAPVRRAPRDGLRALDEEPAILVRGRRASSAGLPRRPSGSWATSARSPPPGGVYVGPVPAAELPCAPWPVDELRERLRVVDGDVGEDLAVDLDAGGLQPVDEPRVARCRAGGPRR